MISRRTALISLSLAPAALAGVNAADAGPVASQVLDSRSFELKSTYLNAAFMHPMPIAAANAIRAFVARRVSSQRGPEHGPDARALFAQLINASPREIAYIPSTLYGENFVVASLGLKQHPAGAKV